MHPETVPRLRNAGVPGDGGSHVRHLPGTALDSRRLYDGITLGGNKLKDSPDFSLTRMSDGTFVTYRSAGKVPNKTTGISPPTIEINVGGTGDMIKLKCL